MSVRVKFPSYIIYFTNLRQFNKLSLYVLAEFFSLGNVILDQAFLLNRKYSILAIENTNLTYGECSQVHAFANLGCFK